MSKMFTKESELCTAFIADATRDGKWVAYPETAGFDIVLSRKQDGLQIGIEAKLALNTHVLNQALPRYRWEAGVIGPDYRAVLVPGGKTQIGLINIAAHLGITILLYNADYAATAAAMSPMLPMGSWSEDHWHEWCPVKRLALPDYVPDVSAGRPSPTALTEWKIKAIRLAIILEERPVTRADFKALHLDPSRWTDKWTGWLDATPQGYVPRPGQIPDFKAQHPVNYEQIKADRAKWMPKPASAAYAQAGSKDLFNGAAT
jgi:hypothetical protein